MGRRVRGRGRGSRRKRKEEDDSETEWEVNSSQQSLNLTSSTQDSFNCQTHYLSAPSRYPARYAKAVLGQGNTSRYPVRSNRWIPSKCSTLASSRSDFVGTDISISESEDIPIAEKITSEIPIQTQDSLNCPTHYSSAPSRYPTRYAKVVLGQGSTSRFPDQSNEWIPIQCSTLASSRSNFVTTDISIPETEDISILDKITSEIPIQTQVSDSLAAALMYPTQHDKTIPNHTVTLRLANRGKAIDNFNNSLSKSNTSNDEVDMENLISKVIFPQTQAQPAVAVSAPHEVVSDNHLSIREANEASNIVGSRLEGSANNANQKEEHRSTRGIPSHSSTLTPSKRDFIETDISSPVTADIPTSEKITSNLPFQTQVSNSQAASLVYPSQHEKTTPSGSPRLAKRGKAIGNINNSISISNISNDEVHLENLISKVILPQTQEDGELIPAPALCAPHVVVTDNHLPTSETDKIIGSRPEGSANNGGNQREDNLGQTFSLNLTEIAETLDDYSCDLNEVGSSRDSALVTVNGYRVKPEWASLLRDIFLRYGDIAKECSFINIGFRSSLLEKICEIIQNLKDTKFIHITPVELKSMLDQVRDLETVMMEVGWLHQRLDDIFEAMQLFRGYSSQKEAQRRRIQVIEKKEEELKSFKMEILALKKKVLLAEDELTPMKAEAEKIDEAVSETKAKVKCFYQKSLVNGLF